MNNKCVKGWQDIDKLYAEFRKVANVLHLRRKTREKENYLAQESPKCSSKPINIYLFIV